MSSLVRLYRHFHVGVDLGQRQDHSALVVVEDARMGLGQRDPVTYEWLTRRERRVRKIERVALGTEYAKVVARVGKLLEARELAGAEVVLAVDGTGVGAAVVEMMRESFRKQRVEIVEMIFTGGMAEHWRGGRFYTAKHALLDRVSLMLEKGELRMAAALPGMAELLEELRGMRRTHGWKLMPKWESAGEHDDLVMALAMAVWGTAHRPVPGKAPRVL